MAEFLGEKIKLGRLRLLHHRSRQAQEPASFEKIHSLQQKARDDVGRSAHKRKRGIYERSRSSDAV